MASTPLKNRTIKATLAATKARRKTQVCRVYALKLNRSKINTTSREHLNRLFLEHKQQLVLEERTYRCPLCRLTIDRDLNAPVNLRLEGLGIDPKDCSSRCPERNTVLPVEIKTATQRMVDHFNGLPFVRASLVAEAGSLRALA
ncbi:MAG: hypothetical protein ACXAB4_01940 [Candidatus Hodarchaeales archaeon]|jgi:hypothetical protein